MTVSTESLVQEVTVLLPVRQLAVAVDVSQPGQPLVQPGGLLTVQLAQGDGGGGRRHLQRNFSHKKLEPHHELISDGWKKLVAC